MSGCLAGGIMPTVFVLLHRDFDEDNWRRAFLNGEAPDKSPYGYHHARSDEWDIVFSKQTATRGIFGLLDRISRRLLGFDLVHAWSNRVPMSNATFLWTHTEREHLAACVLLYLSRRRRSRPHIVAQSVWLMDKWETISATKRWLYRRLLRIPDILTFLSPLNADKARAIFPQARVEAVAFGISLESYRENRLDCRDFHEKRRVLSLGNDVHRDWVTLAAALASEEQVAVRIGSRTFPELLLQPHFEVAQLEMTQARAWFDWADILVVPLRPNLHASGVTTVLEAVALGIPVIATRSGGLEWYFDDDCITYVDAGKPRALREAILELTPATASARAKRAAERFRSADFSTEGYARRHIELSLSLLK
jgi:glycosyltransferase involved in cell wall biosynthesis